MEARQGETRSPSARLDAPHDSATGTPRRCVRRSLRRAGLCWAHGPPSLPRWKAPPPKLLATAESTVRVRCYASQGKAHYFHPGYSGPSTLVLVNAARDVVYVTRDNQADGWYNSRDVPPGLWRVLGWIPCADSLPHGDLEEVDPHLADFEHLPQPNAWPPRSHSIRPNLVIDIVPWDAEGRPEYDG